MDIIDYEQLFRAEEEKRLVAEEKVKELQEKSKKDDEMVKEAEERSKTDGEKIKEAEKKSNMWKARAQTELNKAKRASAQACVTLARQETVSQQNIEAIEAKRVATAACHERELREATASLPVVNDGPYSPPEDVEQFLQLLGQQERTKIQHGVNSLIVRNQLRACPRRPSSDTGLPYRLVQDLRPDVALDIEDLLCDKVLSIDVFAIYLLSGPNPQETRDNIRQALLDMADDSFDDVRFRHLVFLYDMLVPVDISRTLAKAIAAKNATTLETVLLLDANKYVGLSAPIASLSYPFVQSNLLGDSSLSILVPRTSFIDEFERGTMPRILRLLESLKESRAGLPKWGDFTIIPRTWDTESSFAIENEVADPGRLKKINEAIACFKSLPMRTVHDVETLHSILVETEMAANDNGGDDDGDDRDHLVDAGATQHNAVPRLRKPGSEEVFASDGEDVVAVFARSIDVPVLLAGFLCTMTSRDKREQEGSACKKALDAFAAAVSAAFSFVYIHPFEDGNGRLHRLLVHYLLANFDQDALAELPLSVAILEHLDEYFELLSSFSHPVTCATRYYHNDDNGITILNETAAFFRHTCMHAEVEFMLRMLEFAAFDVLPRCLLSAVLADEKTDEDSPLFRLDKSTCDLAARTFNVMEGTCRTASPLGSAVHVPSSPSPSDAPSASPPVDLRGPPAPPVLDIFQSERIQLLYAEFVGPLFLEFREE